MLVVLFFSQDDFLPFAFRYALEANYNWTGLCIEPQSRYWASLAYRERCHVIGAVVGETTSSVTTNRHNEVQFRFLNRAGPQAGVIRSLQSDHREKLSSHHHSAFGEDQRRYTIPLVDIFQRFQSPSVIDYLSFDVEGSEKYILNQDFPFSEYRFNVMTIESPSPGLRDVLIRNGYTMVKKLKKRWDETLWIHEDARKLLDLDAIAAIDVENYKYRERP
jgi:Methyltransferase FkbM domain